MQGLTDNYQTVVLDQGHPDLVNRIVSVLITEEKDGQLVGRVVHA
jgi:hypothetical protein